MENMGQALEDLLVAAQQQNRITFGIYESAELMIVDPDSVLLCVLATDEEEEDDVALQIHFTLIQAFFWDNDIDLVRVSGLGRLAQVLDESNANQPRDLHCIVITGPAEDAENWPPLKKGLMDITLWNHFILIETSCWEHCINTLCLLGTRCLAQVLGEPINDSGDVRYALVAVAVSQALADDDAALVKAYEKAVTSFQGMKTEDEPKRREDGKKEDFSETKDHGKEPDDCKMMTRWAVGSRCLAKWSETGLLHPAVLVWIKGQQCRVKFDGYGIEEEMDLSELLPDNVEQPSGDQQWTLGSRCRAKWSGDGLIYPAVLVWAEGQRGRVVFDVYGNEEELELSALLPPEEQEPSVSTVTEALQRDPDGSSSSGWRKLDKQKISAYEVDTSSSPLSSGANVSGTGGGQSCDKRKTQRSTKKAGSWRGSKIGSRASFCAPPVPLLPEATAGSLSFPPHSSVLPPRSNGNESSSGPDSDVAELSSMLLSWYLCGYHTGYYMALQQTKNSREKTKGKYKTSFKYGNGKS